MVQRLARPRCIDQLRLQMLRMAAGGLQSERDQRPTPERSALDRPVFGKAQDDLAVDERLYLDLLRESQFGYGAAGYQVVFEFESGQRPVDQDGPIPHAIVQHLGFYAVATVGRAATE